MISILDIDEAGLSAEDKSAEWEEEFQKIFNGPLLAAKGIMELLSMSPKERDAKIKAGGKDVERMVKHVDRMRGYMNG
jgi:hypothetical protein